VSMLDQLDNLTATDHAREARAWHAEIAAI
jgi:hypothetical protein